ncbi:hypothetical protein QEZ40_006387 [Streptomyces katrae]|uniref:Uncharacterized protein n=1 Tax=Streptomyces katrae TaxID=68223 RepID=A0ABT7H3T0_9ACTN|nr:hypothetical protein [Streptomyces katrae]MDK9500562.1 hypothetical protein [Streptomyces katrae]
MLRTRIAQAAAVTSLSALSVLGVDAAAGQTDGPGVVAAAASTDSMGW